MTTQNEKVIAELRRGIAQMKYIRIVAAGAGKKADAASFRQREEKLRAQVRRLGGTA
jgi:hypothetical protein